MASDVCELIEVFSGIQGEGPIVGRRQIFLRFGLCDVDCLYCDTPACQVKLESCRIEQTAAKRNFKRFANPYPLAQLAADLERLDADSIHHSVSITGGEPLLQPDAIRYLGPKIAALGLERYLETNGHLVPELEQVLDVVDSIGMDLKIPSTTGFAERFSDNAAFLKLARAAGKDIFVKVIVGDTTDDDELGAAIKVVEQESPETVFVIQPVTPFAGKGCPPSVERLLAMSDLASKRLPNVLVIPQVHKLLRQQ